MAYRSRRDGESPSGELEPIVEGPRERHAVRWSPAEDTLLRELAGKLHVQDIADRLRQECHVPRTSIAVQIRAQKLGISVWWEGYSQHDLERIFAVTFKAIHHWREDGLLEGEKWAHGGRGTFGQWRFTQAAIERFVDRAPWAFDAAQMPPGPFRTRAELMQRRDRWVMLKEAAQLADLSYEHFARYAREAGIEMHRRWAGRGAMKVVRAGDAVVVGRERREAAQQAWRAGVQRRDARRAELVRRALTRPPDLVVPLPAGGLLLVRRAAEAAAA